MYIYIYFKLYAKYFSFIYLSTFHICYYSISFLSVFPALYTNLVDPSTLHYIYIYIYYIMEYDDVLVMCIVVVVVDLYWNLINI